MVYLLQFLILASFENFEGSIQETDQFTALHWNSKLLKSGYNSGVLYFKTISTVLSEVVPRMQRVFPAALIKGFPYDFY